MARKRQSVADAEIEQRVMIEQTKAVRDIGKRLRIAEEDVAVLLCDFIARHQAALHAAADAIVPPERTMRCQHVFEPARDHGICLFLDYSRHYQICVLCRRISWQHRGQRRRWLPSDFPGVPEVQRLPDDCLPPPAVVDELLKGPTLNADGTIKDGVWTGMTPAEILADRDAFNQAGSPSLEKLFKELGLEP